MKSLPFFALFFLLALVIVNAKASNTPHYQDGEHNDAYEHDNDPLKLEEELRSLVEATPFLMFSLKHEDCPACDRVEKLFDTIGLKPTILWLDNHDNMKPLRARAEAIYRRTEWPLVFLAGKTIGGEDKVNALYNGGALRSVIQNGLNKGVS